MSEQWYHTANQLPPENELVRAMDSGGHVQELRRKGNLWFLSDESGYVYYTPKMWSKIL